MCWWRGWGRWWEINTAAHRCVRGRRVCPEVMRRELGGLRMRARERNRCELGECEIVHAYEPPRGNTVVEVEGAK